MVLSSKTFVGRTIAVVLHTPDRHEALAERPFSETAAREAIGRIAARAERELDVADGRWPLDPADAVGDDGGRESGLYCGAAGVAWVLGELAEAGHFSPALDAAEIAETLE